MASIPSSASASIARPESPRELAELVGEIAIRGGAIAPVGGGSKLGFGNLLNRDAELLSTSALDRILAYEPDDMTISVEAGTTIGAVWHELASRGQTIPIDVPNPEKESIGGLIASGLCGPRRYGSGSLRDVLIGIQAAYPDGTLGNAGGMVVKNVSGFDLMRMHLGALGTLGVVVSANFKVLPAARGEATICIARESFDQIERDRVALASGRIRPIAFEAKSNGTGWLEAIRIEGRPATIDQMARELADQLGDASLLVSDESSAFWRNYVAGEALPSGDADLVLQMRGKPSEISKTLEMTQSAFALAEVKVHDLRVSLGLGTVRLAAIVPHDAADGTSNAIHALRGAGSSVLILTAPNEVHRLVDAFGTSDPEMELMRKLKKQFDPMSALNPGRVIPEL